MWHLPRPFFGPEERSMGDKNFRLSTNVLPERYDFTIAPDLEAKTFKVTGGIVLVVGAPTATVTLHGVHLTVTSAKVGDNAATVAADETSQTLTFTFAKPLPAGRSD